MIIKCISFEAFLPEGATRPFLSIDEKGEKWVIKFHGNPLGEETLFNEYIVGFLAEEIRLSWPNVVIAEISQEIMDALTKYGHKPKSRLAVGIKYVDDIEKIQFSSDDYSKRIIRLFPEISMHDQFYGKAIFENWALLQDTKSDTLYRKTDGYPLFLDASFAFGSSATKDWEEDNLVWKDTAIYLKSAYLEPIISDYTKFDPWINSIALLNLTRMKSIFDSIPTEWGVPKKYKQAVYDFICSTREHFVPKFKDWIEWKQISAG